MNHVKFRVFTRRETFTFRLTNISSIIRLLFLDVPQFLKNVSLFLPGLNGPCQRPKLVPHSGPGPGGPTAGPNHYHLSGAIYFFHMGVRTNFFYH